MLLGKRQRPPIKRTTSMTGIPTVEAIEIEPPPSNIPIKPIEPENPVYQNINSNPNGFDHRFLAAMVSPRIHSRTSGDFVETSNFLKMCGLCRRRLTSGRDIYMYRGDTAFCSQECREQQMKQDERKENCTTGKSPPAATSKASRKNEAFAAA